MITFKCKMCGGDLHPEENATTCECEYCGSVQTIATADSEKKMNLIARAQRLLRACDFDKAAGVYESIVAEFPEEAEAYWGLVLCKYGIEYVDDPATGKKVPTCHRSSFDSVMEDGNFEQACENADAIARRVYRDEAKHIEELRKEIIEVSGKEEPYDIFICYKETDENGDRTLDSVLAQDIYDALTEKGYRVFFSRITLEDKLGQEYEPYIFAALNSAKVMLAIGTDYEYYNAVWVKNEWSRFLKLIASGEKKTLIPCYKGIDAYDMPKEFSRLQAQDMGKIGAIQDLTRGIGKIIPTQKDNVTVEPQVIQTVGPTQISLLERGFISLEDGQWDISKKLFDDVLNINPKCAEAYLGLSLATHEFANRDVFAQSYIDGKVDLDHNLNRAREFAGNELADWFDTIARMKQEEPQRRAQEAKRLDDKKKYLATIRQKISAVEGSIICREYFGVGLNADGTVVAEGNNDYGQCNVGNWTNIVAISASDCHTVGLKFDGTVVAVGDNTCGQCNTEDWTGIIAICAAGDDPSDCHTVGLKQDGTVVAVGNNEDGKCDVGDWTDIASIACSVLSTIGLKSNGTVVAAGSNSSRECNVSDWTDITAIKKTEWNTIGIKSNGTVIVTDRKCDVSGWTDIVTLSATDTGNIAGLKSNGTVLSVAHHNEYGQCDVNEWEDIVAVSSSSFHTVGLKSNGTVVAVGSNKRGQCNVSDWTGIVAVEANMGYTVGLKSDGTIVTAGDLFSGEANANALNWKLFDYIDLYPSEKHTGTVCHVSDTSMIPQWNGDHCIECNTCSIVCPHACIHPVLVNEANSAKAPKSFETKDAMGLALRGLKYRIQISPNECTGCEICTTVCPVNKGGKYIALEMKPVHTQNTQEANWEFAQTLPEYEDVLNITRVKDSQFKKTLFDLSGACAGCGGTPYVKLVSQLFGDKMIVANDVNWNNICGGTAPICPYDILGNDHRIGGEKCQEDGDNGSDRSFYIKRLLAKNYSILNKSLWLIINDRLALDIGKNELAYLSSQNKSINILVLDTEARFYGANMAKINHHTTSSVTSVDIFPLRDDLGLKAISCGNIYVAQIVMTDPGQVIKAMIEADAYNGPSLIIAYAPCTKHGIEATQTLEKAHNASESGYWYSYRFNPGAEEKFALDSKPPKTSYLDFVRNEGWYSSLLEQFPEDAEKLVIESQKVSKDPLAYFQNRIEKKQNGQNEKRNELPENTIVQATDDRAEGKEQFEKKKPEIEAIKKIETEQLMKKQAEAERQKRQRQSDLQNEQSHLQQELKSLKGLFTGKRRKEIESRLLQIDGELKRL